MADGPELRLHKLIFPERHGTRTSRAVHRLGRSLSAFACRRAGIDPMESDELCTGLLGHIETLGTRLEEWHRRRI